MPVRFARLRRPAAGLRITIASRRIAGEILSRTATPSANAASVHLSGSLIE
jgi:hypothetical protein